MSGVERKVSDVKFVVEALNGRSGFEEDTIDPGKTSALNSEILQSPISVFITVGNVHIRTLRPKGEGRFSHTPVSSTVPGTLFQAEAGSIVVVFNRGEDPIIKRQIKVNISSEFEV